MILHDAVNCVCVEFIQRLNLNLNVFERNRRSRKKFGVVSAQQ